MRTNLDSLAEEVAKILRRVYRGGHRIIPDLDLVRIKVENKLRSDLPEAARLLGVDHLVYPGLDEVVVTRTNDVVLKSIPVADLTEIIQQDVSAEVLNALGTGVNSHRLLNRIEETDPNMALVIREAISIAREITLRYSVDAVPNISGFKLTLTIRLSGLSVSRMNKREFSDTLRSILEDLEDGVETLQLLTRGVRPEDLSKDNDKD